jgi:hypothetical protein
MSLRSLAMLTFTVMAALCRADPSPFTLTSPLDYQVFQRQSTTQGTIHIAGRAPAGMAVDFHLTGEPAVGHLPVEWQLIQRENNSDVFAADVPLPSGGWYQLEVRTAATTITIAHVGIGEVFVIAGQSNSTNYGSEKQKPTSGKVVSFDGHRWAIADDPQPGTQDRSKGGSFAPAFGDAMFAAMHVPIAIASTGQGSTSVRQWLPRGERMSNPPTILKYVEPAPDGQWQSTGKLFDGLTARLDALGPHGCRAILWHQGESDAGQARAGYPADRQLTGPQYAAFMKTLILATRKHAGWEIPWIVAQATYHSEKDPADEEFRAAQKALWDSGIAIQGPDTDALGKEYRAGVHFNGRGLRAHGEKWAEKVGAWLALELASELKRDLQTREK